MKKLEINNSPIKGVTYSLDLTALSVVPCHVGSGTSEPESSVLVASTGGNISARLFDETDIKKKSQSWESMNCLTHKQIKFVK